MLHRIKVYPARLRLLATLGLSLVTSVGVVLAFAVSPDDTWRGMMVLATALAVAPFIAGWISPHPSHAAFFPASLLVGLSVETVIHGSISYDSEPLLFIPLLTIIYGGLASITFLGGWLAHRALSHLTERR